MSPDHVALVHGGTRRTYRDLAERTAQLASAWRALGVRRGDRVVWRGPNHPAFLESLFASASLGAALAPVSHLLADHVAEDLVSRYQPALVVEHAVTPIRVPDGGPTRVRVDGTGDGLAFEDVLRAGSPDGVDVATTPDELCLMPHTSGTTGRPRGVMLSHRNVTANVINVLSVADVRHDDVTVAIAPFFRAGGTGVNVLPVLFRGGTVVVPDRPGPDELLALLARERVTIGFGNPDLLDALTRSSRWSDADLTSVRWFATGGGPP